MIALDSPRWSELQHAYGSADGIPALLRQLESFPAHTNYKDEPWFTLWSSLCHQGDAYSASFAAVPHIIRVLTSDTKRANANFIELPVCIEIARASHNFPIPGDLREPYTEALQRLAELCNKTEERGRGADLSKAIQRARRLLSKRPGTKPPKQNSDMGPLFAK